MKQIKTDLIRIPETQTEIEELIKAMNIAEGKKRHSEIVFLIISIFELILLSASALLSLSADFVIFLGISGMWIYISAIDFGRDKYDLRIQQTILASRLISLRHNKSD